jgi:hypothetical protein
MSEHAPLSLRHEYELFVERAIEDFKDSVPRSAILKIGDEAVAALEAQAQLALTEMVLWEEVDRIIARRLKVPSFRTWRRRRLETLAKYQRPEHWGFQPDAPLLQAIEPAETSHILVAGADELAPAMYLAANGCAVTALDEGFDAVERVINAAEEAGLAERVRGVVGGIGGWNPDVPLAGLVCTPRAFSGLSPDECTHAIAQLQFATAPGGVHLVEAVVGAGVVPTLSDLNACYRGWDVNVLGSRSAPGAFFARKAVS